ncbi:MAG: hypothetical protein JXR21_04350 [Candidatus Marinimicrobia bacterium]|nr:hypothetical protein [Candidatus Neomarinimicrobiota bacterium]
MKKLYTIWNLVLVSVLGVMGSGCVQDPEPEYGVAPLYGVESAVYLPLPGNEEQEATPGDSDAPSENRVVAPDRQS